MISIIVPCYNEEESIPLFYEEIKKVLNKIKCKTEIIFINDGSKDNSLKIMRDLAKKDKTVRYISFSRNFGKEAGILAGLEASKGDYICMMDVDLQDPPYLLEEMYEEIKKGEYDCIATRSVSRNGYSFFRKILTKWYYKIINKLSKTPIVDGARDFRLMTRQMVNAILNLKEYNRYSKGIFSWVGFNTKWITFENNERVAGTTKWNFWRLFAYSIESIVGFSTMPLLISSIVGIIFCLISFIMIIFIIIKTLLFGDPVAGWPSLVCIIFFVSGMQLFCTGILGEYLAKTYLETKNRPIYIIKETEEDV
ncbi:MAG: glycosyltransferase family 2 protein [Firmicutes bacterium]|nr:glycosyltransferase family 2 protein [Bacillota bacterium]